jgi:DnaJ-class molecular chaperone
MATEQKPDYYEVLGVARTATAEQLRTAFEMLAATFRASDKPRNIDDVEEIRAIAAAYRVLSDTEKRRSYDRLGYWLPEEGILAADWAGVADSEGNWIRARELAAAILDGILAGTN